MFLRRLFVIILLLIIFVFFIIPVKAETIEELLKKGNNFYQEGRYTEAIECYNKVLEIDSHNLSALCNRGNSLYALGYYEESILCYNETLKIDPENSYALKFREEAEKALTVEKEKLDTPEELWSFYNGLLLDKKFDQSLKYMSKDYLEEYEILSPEEKEIIKTSFLNSGMIYYDVIKRKAGENMVVLYIEGSPEAGKWMGEIYFIREEGAWKISRVLIEGPDME